MVLNHAAVESAVVVCPSRISIWVLLWNDRGGRGKGQGWGAKLTGSNVLVGRDIEAPLVVHLDLVDNKIKCLVVILARWSVAGAGRTEGKKLL